MVFNPRGGDVNVDAEATNIDRDQTGATRKRVERIEFIKNKSKKRNIKKVLVHTMLKTSDVTKAATIEAWLDNDADWDADDDYTGSGSPDDTKSTSSLTAVALKLEIDTSAAADGLHVVNIALKSASAGGIATSTAREYEFEKDRG